MQYKIPFHFFFGAQRDKQKGTQVTEMSFLFGRVVGGVSEQETKPEPDSVAMFHFSEEYEGLEETVKKMFPDRRSVSQMAKFQIKGMMDYVLEKGDIDEKELDMFMVTLENLQKLKQEETDSPFDLKGHDDSDKLVFISKNMMGFENDFSVFVLDILEMKWYWSDNMRIFKPFPLQSSDMKGVLRSNCMMDKITILNENQPDVRIHKGKDGVMVAIDSWGLFSDCQVKYYYDKSTGKFLKASKKTLDQFLTKTLVYE